MAHELSRIGGGLTAFCLGMNAAAAHGQPPSAPARIAPSAAPGAAPPPQSDSELMRPLTPLDRFTLAPPPATARAPPPPSVRYATEIKGLAAIGLEKDFRSNSALERGGGKAASALQIDARAQQDRDLIERLLRAHGYYQGHALISAKSESEPGHFRVLVTVAPGRRFHFSSVTVSGPATQPPGLVREALTLRPGDPIATAPVLAAESNVSLRLPQQGYPFVKLGDRDIALDPSSATGAYTLPVSPGPRSSFGAFQLHEPVFDARHVSVIARFKPGQLYDSRMVDDLRRALVATGLFAAVGVEPVDTGKRAADGTEIADLQVQGSAGPPHALSASLGYETGVGLTFEGAWSNLNMFPPEGALTLHVITGNQQQLIGLQFTRSNAGARDRTVFAQVQSSRQTTDAYNAYTGLIDARVSRASTPIWHKIWTYSAGVEAMVSDEQAFSLEAGERVWRTYKITGFRLSAGYDRSNDLLNPTRGFQILASLDPETQFSAGTHPFLQGTLQGRLYVPATTALTLAVRLRMGALFGIDAQQLAPSRRFYEGGGTNIRGFGFQEVGPKAPDGSPIGGASSTDFSLEARYRFGNYGVVAFVDGGQTYETSTPRFTDFRYGVGLGGRYYTNFGPVRIDVATPIARRPGESLIGVYISIGQAF